jgi:NAD+ synthase
MMPLLGEDTLRERIGPLQDGIASVVDGADATGVVIRVSGGIDSAVVAALCSRCVDTQALIMPDTSQSSPSDTDDAIDLCTTYDIPYSIIDIGGPVRAIIDNYARHQKVTRLALGNVRARVRMTYLYLCANVERRLVAGTSNRSEWLLGYSTKWGDSAADFYPVGDLMKSEIYTLADILGISKTIIEKPPSAGLYPGQTDEAELGASYDVIDQVLISIEDEHMGPTEAGKRIGNEPLARSLYDRMVSTAHKRVMPRSLEVRR